MWVFNLVYCIHFSEVSEDMGLQRISKLSMTNGVWEASSRQIGL